MIGIYNQIVKSVPHRAKVLVLVIGLLSFLAPSGLPAANLFQNGSNIASAASDPVIAAAGDIACDPADLYFNFGNGIATSCRQKYTANLLINKGLAGVLALGDTQYNCGGYQAFLQSYNLSWGQVKSITHPTTGNHEYENLPPPPPSSSTNGTDCSTNAAGYFQYYGAAAGDPTKGYYSFDIGAWHLISLNSSCSTVGGCKATNPQGQWLQADLATHQNSCVLAFWHIPLFSSAGLMNNNAMPFWQILYAYHADVVLVVHAHVYERFAPQTPTGAADPVNGIRQFTVGTGGGDHGTFQTPLLANSQVQNADTFGVLELTLHANSYDWKFVPEAGGTFTDSGTTACHPKAVNTLLPDRNYLPRITRP